MAMSNSGTMNALRAYAPNDPDQLRYESSPLPCLHRGDALVQVLACGITPNELTWPTTWIDPDGSPRQLPIVPGHEVSGVVAALGDDASGLQLGDAVFGLVDFQRDGAAAEFVAAREVELAPKPAKIDHVHAAATPLVALTAWQALFDHAQLAPGQRILIHGGAGGVGSFAIQLAHWRGAWVTATASARNIDAVRALGADEVIDYHATAFDSALHDIDVVFDTVGGDTWERSWSVLRPGGVLVSIAVPRPSPDTRRGETRSIWFVVTPNRDQLIEIARLIDQGALAPVVGRVLPLAEGRDAFESARHTQGARFGKTVLAI